MACDLKKKLMHYKNKNVLVKEMDGIKPRNVSRIIYFKMGVQ